VALDRVALDKALSSICLKMLPGQSFPRNKGNPIVAINTTR